MRKMKKFLAGLAAGVICAAALPLVGAELLDGNGLVSAEEYTISTETGTVTFSYDTLFGDTVIISGCVDSSIAGELEIPSKIEGKTVTEIGPAAFYDYSSITKVVIPDSVTSIGWQAFKNCTALEEISLSEGLQTVEEETFRGCTALKKITFPESTKEISYNSFRGCTNLEMVVIPETVTTIEGSAFWETPWFVEKQKEDPLVVINGILIDGSTCTGNVIIPDNVKKIASWSFYNCESLQEIQIPEGVTKIDYSAFCNCANLKSITIPSSMTWIDDVYGEESDCRSITNITYNGTISQWKTIEKQSLKDVAVNCVDGTISKKADLDGNGKIDTSDIFDAMVYVAYRGVGLDGGLTDEQVAAADIDGDGKVDSTDIYYMLYYVALQGAGKNPSWQDVIY